MADLSKLGTLNPIEQLDATIYPDAKEKEFQLAPKGIYNLRAPESFPDAVFGKTKNGDLSVQIDPTIADGSFAGNTIRFQKISAKTFDRAGKPASQVADYLRACGWRGTIGSPDDAANAVEATAGCTFRAKVDWRAYNKRNPSFVVQGMEKFPKRADGSYQPWVIDPAEMDVEASKKAGHPIGKQDENNRELRVYANLEIPFGGFVPATS
jgi:hypothetical protein